MTEKYYCVNCGIEITQEEFETDLSMCKECSKNYLDNDDERIGDWF